MPRNINLFRILLIISLITSLILINQTNPAIAAEPSKLKIYVGLTSVPADNKEYQCVFVQLQDSNSRPARALQDTPISLSSSLTSVGTIDPTITITAGNTFAMAKFYSTFTPGTTTLTAAASSYATVQTTLKTIGPIPTTLAVSAFPPTLPSDGNAYPAIIVQLLDSIGNPARAPIGGLTVDLRCSNTNVGTIQDRVTLQEGKTFAIVDFQTNPLGTLNPAAYVGTAEIIAIAQDYISQRTTIRTQAPATEATNLKVYVTPSVIMADNIVYQKLIAVQLQNSGGVVSKVNSDVAVSIASSEPLVGTVPVTLTIPANKNYGLTQFTSTYHSGSTTITAGATNYKSSTATLSTTGSLPTRLTIYCSPTVLPADHKLYNTIQVQLQDAAGKPALDPDGNVNVSLFSSEPDVGTVPIQTLTIPYGETYATTNFVSTYQAGTTSITAQASDYSTAQVSVNTYMIDYVHLDVSLTANPNPVNSGTQTNIIARVTCQGVPITGATVKFTSSSGGTFSPVTSAGNGLYNTTFKAPSINSQTDIVINATASRTDYATRIAAIKITVFKGSILPATLTLPGTLTVCIKDDAGQPVTEAVVSTLSQPTGMKRLMDITNSTGYVVFRNVIAGDYTINVKKEGYQQTNSTISYTSTTSVQTLFMLRNSGTGISVDWTILGLVIVVVIVAVVVVIAAYLQRRKTQSRFKVPEKWTPPPPPPPQLKK